VVAGDQGARSEDQLDLYSDEVIRDIGGRVERGISG
jgi:hypothetical protein